MDDVTRIIQSLEKSRILLDGVTETVKFKKREQETWFIAPLLPSKCIFGKGVMRVVRGVMRAGRESNSKDRMNKVF